MESANLYYREGSSDKVYHATLEKKDNGFIVNFAYGRRGNALTTGTKTPSPVTQQKAKDIFDKLIKEKMGKGYRHIEGGSTASIAVAEPSETPTEMQCNLLNPIDADEVDSLLSSSGWAIQRKHDGVRLMLRKQGNRFSGINRKGKQVGVAATVFNKFAHVTKDFFLDGELVGDTYHVFDILEIDGKCIRSQSVKKRYETLVSLGVPDVSVLHIESKKEFYDHLVKTNAEGCVFKKLEASYSVGRPASGGNYLKYKFFATASCIVSEINDKRSVGLVLLDGKKKVLVGNVTIPVNFDIPAKNDVVEVKYLYAYEGGSLYQPIYRGNRSDIDLDECVISQLKYKREEN